MIITGNINSENPSEHWGRLNVKDRIVLDMGCGRIWDTPTTPEYFLSQGASKIIGVEMWDNEKTWFDALNLSDIEIITDRIDTPEKLRSYIDKYLPDVIKCDIEGDEKILESFDFTGIKELAIEYHNEEMKAMIENNSQLWGFDRIELWSMSNFDVNKQGVIYLFKI